MYKPEKLHLCGENDGKAGIMAEEFKRLDRELMYHGTIVDFYKDTVQVPNGNIVKWDFIGHKGAAAVVPELWYGSTAMRWTAIRWKFRQEG